MNCLSCNNNLINNKTSNTYYFMLNEKGNCIEECEDNFFLTSIGECVSNCPDGTFKFSYNHKCLKTCPHNYIINKDKNECILKSIDQNSSILINKVIDIQYFEDYNSTVKEINKKIYQQIINNYIQNFDELNDEKKNN